MQKTEQIFDINRILLQVFSSVSTLRKEKNNELIYEMDATIPRELKGNPVVLT